MMTVLCQAITYDKTNNVYNVMFVSQSAEGDSYSMNGNILLVFADPNQIKWIPGQLYALSIDSIAGQDYALNIASSQSTAAPAVQQ